MGKLNLLTAEQRVNYFYDGFLCLRGFINDEWLTQLNDAAERAINYSRSVIKTNDWLASRVITVPKSRVFVV